MILAGVSRLSGAGVALAATVALSGCANGTTTSGQVSGIDHVHGVDYDPASDRLFVASHSGLWWLELGSLGFSGTDEFEFEPVDALKMDVMGFSVPEPGRMVASGHPGPDGDRSSPANLGLLAGSNGGEEWDGVSLYGEADFHDIAAVETDGGLMRLYGYDSTSRTILVSEDGGARWRSGAEMVLRDLAAGPSDPDTVYATTPDSLVRSTDGARTFEPVTDAPHLVLIDAADGDSAGLFGVDNENIVWSLRDGASSWTRTGDVGSPLQAFTFASVGDRELLLAVNESSVIASNNGGTNWYTLAPLSIE